MPETRNDTHPSYLADAIRLLQETATKHAQALAKIEAERRFEIITEESVDDRYWIVRDGEIEERPTAAPSRAHTVERMEDLVSLLTHVDQCADSYLTQQSAPTVWVGRRKIVAVFDEPRRVHRATMPLVYTPAWEALLALSGAAIEQPDLVMRLRTSLHGLADELLLAVRNVKFNYATGATGEVQAGRQSLDQSLLAEVTGAKELPEVVFFETQIYQQLELTGRVGFALHADALTRRFHFAVLGAGFTVELAARREVREQLVDLLAGREVHVLLGECGD